MKQRNSLLNDRTGFTIIEVMVGVGLAAVAAAVIFSIFISTQESYYDNRRLVETQSEPRLVMSLMTQELRSAGSDVNDIGVQRLMAAGADTVRVQSDLNSDGFISSDEPAEDVAYYYNPSNKSLVRDTGNGSPVEIMSELDTFQLEYLDGDGNTLSPLPLDGAGRNSVRAIRLTMGVDIDGEGSIRYKSTVVALRNDPAVN